MHMNSHLKFQNIFFKKNIKGANNVSQINCIEITLLMQ
jgi:hypothetical protein